jgi:hypothetical protein
MSFLQKLEPLAEGEIFKDERLWKREKNQTSRSKRSEHASTLAVVPARLLKSQVLACDLILAKHSRTAIL